jgi:hypothetical protein
VEAESHPGVSFHIVAGTVVNFGSIEDARNIGVYLQVGGRVTNETHALITGAAAGIYVQTTGTLSSITNFGTIAGAVGVGFAAANSAANTLTNAGTVTGSGGTAVQFGAGNDLLIVDRGAVFNGAVNGGGGTNVVKEASAGTLDVKGFIGFETIVLANGGKDSLTLTQANFTGVTDNEITVTDGDKGNDVTATGLSAADILVVHAGAGPDILIGGSETDIFYAGGDTTMSGGSGANEFIFTTAGNNVINDFALSSANELVFSDKGFTLGLSGATATLRRLTASEAAKLFIADTTGKFTDTKERLAYDTKTGQLFASRDGSGGTKELVATLSDHPTVHMSQLFFIT